MTETLYNAVVSEMEALTEAGTNIKTNKYDVFREARKRVNSNERYRDVKDEVRDIMETFCTVNNYTFTKNFNGEYDEYFINTEPVETRIEASSRNRMYIPAEYVKQAGFNPGDYVYVAQYDGTNDLPIYEVTRDTPDFKNANVVHGATVEKHGGIRFTVPYTFTFFDKQVTVGAGIITVAP